MTGWFYLAFSERCQRYIERHAEVRARPAVSGRGRGAPLAGQDGAQRRHQGDRSGNRQDDVVVSADAGVADRACWRPQAASCSSLAAKEHLRAGRADGRVALALPDRRRPSTRRRSAIGRRQAVRRRLRRQRVYSFAIRRVTTVNAELAEHAKKISFLLNANYSWNLLGG